MISNYTIPLFSYFVQKRKPPFGGRKLSENGFHYLIGCIRGDTPLNKQLENLISRGFGGGNIGKHNAFFLVVSKGVFRDAYGIDDTDLLVRFGK